MSNWLDYTNNSELTLVFGHVSAEVRRLSPAGETPEVWAFITHPYYASPGYPSREEAKAGATQWLTSVLNTAVANLPTSN